MFVQKAFMVMLASILCVNASYADPTLRLKGLGTLFWTDFSQPNSFSVVPDPLSESAKDVLKFSIRNLKCQGEDCSSQSVRSSFFTDVGKGQPRKSWYGWDVYFPVNFPYGNRQSSGYYQFIEWKNHHACQRMAFSNKGKSSDNYLSFSLKRTEGSDCIEEYSKSIVSFKELVGNWHRFEVYIEWSSKEDGRAEVYLDGKLRLDYSGPTCDRSCSMNYFLIGIYLCCTRSTEAVTPAEVFYKNVSNATVREKLLVNK